MQRAQWPRTAPLSIRRMAGNTPFSINARGKLDLSMPRGDGLQERSCMVCKSCLGPTGHGRCSLRRASCGVHDTNSASVLTRLWSGSRRILLPRSVDRFMYVASTVLLLKGSAVACTLCDSRTAEHVRQTIFGPDFVSNLALTAIPFAICFAVVYGIHVVPRNRRNR